MSKSPENCSECGKILTSKQEVEEHGKNEHTEDRISEIKCSTCTRIFNSKSSLRMHMKMNHQPEVRDDQSSGDVILDPQNLSCLLCKMEFLSIEQMDSHMDEMHGGRWKFGDVDVVGEEDVSEEITSDYSDTESEEVDTSEDSKSEDSEI